MKKIYGNIRIKPHYIPISVEKPNLYTWEERGTTNTLTAKELVDVYEMEQSMHIKEFCESIGRPLDSITMTQQQIINTVEEQKGFLIYKNNRDRGINFFMKKGDNVSFVWARCKYLYDADIVFTEDPIDEKFSISGGELIVIPHQEILINNQIT